MYFFALMEKEYSAKGKGKNGEKDDGKIPTIKGSTKWKKSFEVEKKELLDMIEMHIIQEIEVVNSLSSMNDFLALFLFVVCFLLGLSLSPIVFLF